MRVSIVILLLLILPAMLLVCGCSSRNPNVITKNAVLRVKVGMSYPEVVKALGSKGAVETNGKIFNFSNYAVPPTGKMVFLFKQGKIIHYFTKGEYGGSQDFYWKMKSLRLGKDGYNEVKDQLGRDGIEVVGAKSYVWTIDDPGTTMNGKKLHVIVQDGKVIDLDDNTTVNSENWK